MRCGFSVAGASDLAYVVVALVLEALAGLEVLPLILD